MRFFRTLGDLGQERGRFGTAGRADEPQGGAERRAAGRRNTAAGRCNAAAGRRNAAAARRSTAAARRAAHPDPGGRRALDGRANLLYI